MTPRRWLRGALPLAILLAVPLAILLAAGSAGARPGGGHTSSGSFSSSHSSSGGGFSSSHSSSSGGSHSTGGGYYYGGGGGDINGGIVFLGLLLVVIVVAAAVAASSAKNRGWTSNFAMMPEPDAAPDPGDAWSARPPPLDLEPLMKRDPGFSRAVFEDFAFELYAAAQRERGDGKLLRLQPYLSPAALDQLAARGVAPQQVVIGTLQIEAHAVEPPRDQLHVRIEATHIGTRAPVYVVEHWVFARSVDAQSRPPERTRTWPCPNCGAPWQPSPTRQCAHCGQAVEVGKFDWCVEDISVASETRALASLTGTVPEYGNDLPTVVDPAAHAMLAQISADDPAVTFETLRPRILLIYQQLNTAWNARDLPPVRGLVTAALRNYLEYWLHEYDHQGLHNTLTDARVSRIDLAKVTRDRYYDAITVRIFADGFDVTRDTRGKIVGGSTGERRAYTEYWTFLRSSTRRGPVTTTPACPNCGAPLAISDLGDCTHCGVAVENGSFDWTLSKIEQDDNYTG